jgi:protein-tyrosine kinase
MRRWLRRITNAERKGIAMEWFQAALDRYKQQQPQNRPAAAAPQRLSPRSVPAQIVYTRTRSVHIPEAVLRERRIVAGFEGGPVRRCLQDSSHPGHASNAGEGLECHRRDQPRRARGKTFTAVNLAISLAMDVTQSVLLVDANLQAPQRPRGVRSR